MDPYVYPGTEVLKNRRDIRDGDRLDSFEAMMTTRRLAELQDKPMKGAFNAQYLSQIHRYIFQDVYDWAGKIRTVDMSRSGQFPFAFTRQIDSALDKTFADLKSERSLAGLDRETFAGRAAHYLGELNAIHPFREGNGRTQREFIRRLAGSKGFAIDWSLVRRERMYEASQLSFERADNSGLESILRSALRPDSRAVEVLRIRDAIQVREREREKDRDRER
jgi:cell filamentation protein